MPYNIYELLTPIALAHMIKGDGSVERQPCGVRSAECGVRSAECGVRSAECGVLIIYTNSYSIEDVVRLMNVLIIRYRLECKIR